MTVVDLKSIVDLGHSALPLASEGMADAYGTNCIFTARGFPTQARVQQMRTSVPWQLQDTALQVSRSVSVHGLCAAHRSRKPTGHRDLLAGDAAQDVSCRSSIPGFQEHPGRCQREPGLAHLRRLRSGAHWPRPQAIQPRRLRSTTRRDRVCLRFQHHRSVSFAVSVGPIPSAQSRHQAPHVDGSTRQYPLFYSHYRGEDARCRLCSTN